MSALSLGSLIPSDDSQRAPLISSGEGKQSGGKIHEKIGLSSNPKLEIPTENPLLLQETDYRRQGFRPEGQQNQK